MKLAYLVNQYPKVSHSFIRREILGVEAQGMEVVRYAIRSCQAELVDEADKAELAKTRVMLDAGVATLLRGMLQICAVRPARFFSALKLAFKLGAQSDAGIVKHLAYLAEACVLLRWSREDHVSHIHAHFGTNSATVALLCQALGGPSYSFTVHGPEEFDKVEAIALPEKICRAAFVVAISSYGRSQLYRWCSLEHWSKIHVVHCGVDDSFLHQPTLPIPEQPTVVCVGRLCEQKGQLLLVDAVAQLAAEGLQFRLLLVGDGPLRSSIEALIVRNKLHDVVEITGWASNAEVRQYILASRALVLPSFAEGLPVVIMEALSLQRPVLSTFVAGIPELVEPGACGWLIPAGSINALVEALRSVLQSPVDALARMGKLGAQRVAEQHAASIEAEKLVKLFRMTAEKFMN